MENNVANETNELWAIYAWWSCVLALKMFSLAWFTGRIRVDRQVKWILRKTTLILMQRRLFLKLGKNRSVSVFLKYFQNPTQEGPFSSSRLSHPEEVYVAPKSAKRNILQIQLSNINGTITET